MHDLLLVSGTGEVNDLWNNTGQIFCILYLLFLVSYLLSPVFSLLSPGLRQALRGVNQALRQAL